MWTLLKTIIQLILLVLFCMFILALYRYSKNEVEQKKKNIEKFIQKYQADQDPAAYSKEDFSIYSKIMGIYKHKLGKSPSQDELFMCYDKIKANELTYEQLESTIDEHGHDYKTFLFPELNYSLVEVKTEEEEVIDDAAKSTDAIYEDETLVEEEKESPMKLKDDVKNQYILHRPTIYNISNQMVDKDFSTENFMKAVKAKVKSLESDDTDSELDMDEVEEEQPTTHEVESKKYKNRCGTKEERDLQNALATKKEARNMQELEAGCAKSTKREKLAHEFDDMVLRHDQMWKMPERRPPVCKMNSKKKCPVNAIEVQSSLIGTLLDDSKNTKVGSILPKFSYKEKN